MSLNSHRMLRNFPKNTRVMIEQTAALSDELGYTELQVVIAAAVKAQAKVTRALLATNRSRARAFERLRKFNRQRHYELAATGQSKRKVRVTFLCLD